MILFRWRPLAAKLLIGFEKIKDVQKLYLYAIYRMVPLPVALSDPFQRANLYASRVTSPMGTRALDMCLPFLYYSPSLYEIYC